MIPLTDDTFDKILKFIKKYAYLIAAIGGVLLILNLTGFNINIPAYYNSLDVDGKIAFMGFFNFIITIFMILAILKVISSRPGKSS